MTDFTRFDAIIDEHLEDWIGATEDFHDRRSVERIDGLDHLRILATSAAILDYAGR